MCRGIIQKSSHKNSGESRLLLEQQLLKSFSVIGYSIGGGALVLFAKNITALIIGILLCCMAILNALITLVLIKQLKEQIDRLRVRRTFVVTIVGLLIAAGVLLMIAVQHITRS
jgi:hypothetical protein